MSNWLGRSVGLLMIGICIGSIIQLPSLWSQSPADPRGFVAGEQQASESSTLSSVSALPPSEGAVPAYAARQTNSFGSASARSAKPSMRQASAISQQVGSLQVMATTLANGVQQVVVLDAEGLSMAVYHIDPVQARIELKSVRELQWDLQMEHFNGLSPLPGELREMQP